MSLLKDALETLDSNDREALIHSSMNEIPHTVKMDNGRFIGVYINVLDTMTVLETHEHWIYGIYR